SVQIRSRRAREAPARRARGGQAPHRRAQEARGTRPRAGQRDRDEIMPIVFKATAIVVTGSLQTVFDQVTRGLQNLRLIVRNSGFTALTAAQVQVRGEAGGAPATIDAAKFATLAAGATAELVIAGPTDVLRLLATCAVGWGPLL